MMILKKSRKGVTSAEWIQNNKKPVTCPFGKKEPETYVAEPVLITPV